MVPQVSVVVSTFERPDGLRRLITGLRAQTLAADAFELVVVDNGSGPATGRVLAEESERGGLALRTVRHERTLGPAGGRNAGWRIAAAPLVAFTDDDCVPAPGWLEHGLAVAAQHPAAILQGRTEPDPSAPAVRALTAHTNAITALSPSYETCNIFYPRALLAELGGFDERFPSRPAGEDTELAWRAIERGTEAVFAPEALVWHAVVDRGYAGTLRAATRWGPGTRVFALRPGARAVLYHRVFWNVWHYLLVRSTLSLLAPAWLRRILLRRHLRALRERCRRAGAGDWAIAYLLLYDALEASSLLAGSVRNGTLIL